MKNLILTMTVLLSGATSPVPGATTIDPVNKYACGANFGWMDWSGGAGLTASGVVIGQYVCAGSIDAANVGWINLGSGSPADGIQYQNNSAGDYGVNMDGLGNLRGYAYGANIGWINFEAAGAPALNLVTGQMSGFIWSANCGWISLNNAAGYVQTDTISPGALDPDGSGLPMAWELTYFGTTGVDPNADADGDGASNYAEYLAGTSPVNGSDYLRITHYAAAPGGHSANLSWASVPTRYYYIQETSSLGLADWVDNHVGLVSSQGSMTTTTITDAGAPNRFYRIQAVRPLMP